MSEIKKKPQRIPDKVITFPENFMNLDFGERIGYADLIIRQHGYRLIYEKMVFCPCISLVTSQGFSIEGGMGQPNPSCPKCQGTGRIYQEGVESMGIISALNRRVLEYLRHVGRVDVGTYMATLHSELTVDYLDRFYLIDVEIPINELFSNSIDNTYHLAHNPVKVEFVYLYAPNKENPAESIVEQLSPSDWIVDYNTDTLEIRKANLPPVYNLSVKYLGRPWFYVTDLIHFYRMQYVSEHFDRKYKVKLPQSVICRRGDLFKL
jgi:hypothetical protein